MIKAAKDMSRDNHLPNTHHAENVEEETPKISAPSIYQPRRVDSQKRGRKSTPTGGPRGAKVE